MPIVSVTSVDEYLIYQNPDVITAVKQLAGYDAITANGTTQDINVTTAQTRVTADITSSLAKLPAGRYPGQRKVVTLAALGSGDTLVLTPAAGVPWKQADGTTNCASVTFDALNEFLLVEWNGARWTNINTTATVA